MKTAALCALILTLAGCASIPLGTMWRMMGFSIEEFRTINPAGIHAAVLVPDDIVIKDVTMAFAMSTEDGKYPEKIINHILTIQKEGQFIPVPVPVAEEGWHWYYTDLPPEAEAEFIAFQQNWDDLKKKYDSLDFSVSVNIDHTAKTTPEEFEFSLWVQLKETEGWFALFENAAVDVKKMQSDDTNTNTN